ncbi:MAG: endopeptidase La [Deltaproteobacteria bacterium]|nr:MAG: endopeptidase La [Deltaproteobacteria bacterium]
MSDDSKKNAEENQVEPKESEEETSEGDEENQDDAEIVGVEMPWSAEQEAESIPEGFEALGGPGFLLRTGEKPPSVLFAFPLRESTLFPDMTVPVLLEPEALKELMLQEEQQRNFVAFFSQKKPTDVHGPEDLHAVGVTARVLRVTSTADGLNALVVQVTHRCRIERFVLAQPHKMVVRVELLHDEVKDEDSVVIEALTRNLNQLLQEVASLSPNIAEEFVLLVQQLDSPSHIADFVALQFLQTIEERQPFLETLDLRKRLEMALTVLLKESEMLKLQNQLREEIHSQMEQRQREFLLREQLRLIRKELGDEVGEKELDAEKYESRIKKARMPEEAEERAQAELRRLSVLPPEAAEYNIIRTYLDWLCDLPWSRRSDARIDLRRARAVLNRDHHGLERVKERILEFLAVHKLKPDQKGAILCLSGPPGVGKTSLGRSIAEAMGRKFYRFSVGGMRDEAEIKGHRRTYVGAMPGKLLQALRRVDTRNPVIMIDEIDKMGKDWRGDPASAMLEVLDPSQNQSFLDHYLDVSFDLSEVMFVATANYRDMIPKPLLDRMEVIELSGYIPEEKVEIARKYLLPRQREAHGLEKNQLQITRKAFHLVVDRYTREAGVRELERQIASVCRKVATRVASQSSGEDAIRVRVQDTNVEQYLGAPRYLREESVQKKARPGRVRGLAWTPVGGESLIFEATQFKGTGKLELTGKLGEVMTESSRIALSFLKSHAEAFSIDLERLAKLDLHLHAPAGAVPKDGPSAGVAITTAFLSLLTNEPLPVPSDFAMTGEITLLGDVLPVGGIREKVVAATSIGIPHVILPEANRKDADEVPDYIRDKLTFHFVSHYNEVAELLFPQQWDVS